MTTLRQLEAALVTDVRLELGRRADTRIFRNNTGALPTPTGGVLHYGLCAGSSDLIGLRSVTVTPDMVGKQVAIFCALEGKQLGKYPSKEQRAFLAMVKSMGGRAGVFRNLSDAWCIVDGLR